MTIETKYNIGDTFFVPNGKKVMELSISGIETDSTAKRSVTKYRFANSTSYNYISCNEDEVENKINNNELFLTKKDMLKYFIDLLSE